MMNNRDVVETLHSFTLNLGDFNIELWVNYITVVLGLWIYYK